MKDEDDGLDLEVAAEILEDLDAAGYDVTETRSGLAIIGKASDYIAELETRDHTPYL